MIPQHLFLYQHLEASAAAYPDKMAVRDENSELSYLGLHRAALSLAHELTTLGVTPGDRVVIYLENSVNFARAFWAATYCGAVVTPVNVDTKADKLAWIVQDCTPAALLADPVHLEMLKETLIDSPRTAIVDVSGPLPPAPIRDIPCKGRVIDQDLGGMIYTSGSTGLPKGVMLSHQNLAAASRSVCTYLGYRNDDTLFVCIPLTFDYGMHQLTMAALVGASVVIETNFSAPLFTLHRLSKSGATCFPLVPTMVPLIKSLADRYDFSDVRLISSTAAALHVRVIDELGEIFTNATIFSMYGLTECHRCTYLPPDQLETRKGSVGIAIPNTEMWVVDNDGVAHTSDAVGELVIRGSTVMKGYWNNPAKTAERLKPGKYPGEFALHTGDLCRLDAEGYLYFLARSDDILKIRGEKVAPKEVEDVLLAHDAISEAIVFGKDDALQGQVVHACITLAPGATATAKELRAYCKTKLETIAVPKGIDIHDHFARNANGKIDRKALLDQFA